MFNKGITQNFCTIFFTLSILLNFFIVSHGFYGAKYEPPDGKVYHGVGWHIASQINYMNMFPADKKPLLVQHITAMPGTRGMSVSGILKAFSQSHISPDSQYMEMSTHFEDNNGPLDSVFAYTSQMDHYIDTMAIALKTHGRPVFLRIGLEMNGAWNGYTPWTFPKAYRKLVEGLRAQNVDNIATVWCYEPDAPPDFADSTAQGWKWYPGDDVVDWFSLDPFPSEHFDPALPDSSGGNITKKGKSELFLRFAQERGKPVYLNETTAHSAHITPDASDPDSADAKHDWDNWFAPFLQFLSNHPNIKAFNYINLDWTPYTQWQHWGDARIHINTYIRDRWVAALTQDNFIAAGYDIENQNSIQNQLASQQTSPFISVLPNPHSGQAGIIYQLDRPGHVIIHIYNLSGQLIKIVVKGKRPQGSHLISLNMDGLPVGMYILKGRIRNHRISHKFMIIK
jgi:hypothetical protein